MSANTEAATRTECVMLFASVSPWALGKVDIVTAGE